MVLATKDDSFFYSSSWAKVLHDSYKYNPIYFTLFNRSGLLALIPVMQINGFLGGRRGVSLPFTDYCEPLISEEIQFQYVFREVIEFGKKKNWKFLELRGGEKYLHDALPCSSYYVHILPLLQHEDHIFSSFRGNTKRNIKKAIKNGVEVKICNSLESIKEFYRLNCTTKKKHGLPPQPYYFFKKVYDHIISKNLGFIALASFQGEAIAGAVFFHFGEKALFKYGASDINYQNLRPNNLVMWEAIKWCYKNGYKIFCFGRTEPVNTGLRRFKKGWGTEEHIINYYRYDLIRERFITNHQKLSPLQNRILSNTPGPLLDLLGSLFYKYMG